MKFKIYKKDTQMHERIKLKRLIAKMNPRPPGDEGPNLPTVREVRELWSKFSFVESVGSFFIFAFFFSYFVPFSSFPLFWVIVPFTIPIMHFKRKKKLAALLPVQHDNDTLEVV